MSGEIPVSLADRWFLLGMTGTGKTTFAQRLMRELRGLYPEAALFVLDSKGDPLFARWPGVDTRQEPPPIPREPGGIQVWSPPWDDAAGYDAWFGEILKARRPAVVFVDELSSIGGARGADFPVNFARLLKQGRALGISAIVLSQEAAYIPRQVMNQATHAAVFRLQDDVDLRRAAKLLGFDDPRNPEREHGFHYRRLAPAPGVTLEYPGFREFF